MSSFTRLCYWKKYEVENKFGEKSFKESLPNRGIKAHDKLEHLLLTTYGTCLYLSRLSQIFYIIEGKLVAEVDVLDIKVRLHNR